MDGMGWHESLGKGCKVDEGRAEWEYQVDLKRLTGLSGMRRNGRIRVYQEDSLGGRPAGHLVNPSPPSLNTMPRAIPISDLC